MPDIKGNNKQIFDFLSSKGASGIGNNADEFQKFMEKEENRRQVYDYLSSSKATGLGNSYEEFSSFVYDGGQQEATGNAPQRRPFRVSPNPTVEQAYQEMMAPKQEEKPAEQPQAQAQPQPQPEPAPQQQAEPQAQEKANPFPYRGGLEEEMQEIAKLRESVAEDAAFVEEYEKRKSEEDRKARNTIRYGSGGFASYPGDGRGENEKWLKENEARYKEAKSNVAHVEKAASGTENAIGKAENDIARRKNREEMASPQEIIATGRTAFGRDNAGREDSEHELRKFADELYASADKEYDKSSKYQEGYEGDGWEQLWTGIKDFGADALNNIDSGSLTFGASKGLALTKAREVGDKYNEVINNALKGMKMSDGDISAVLSSIEDNGSKLQRMEEELTASSAEIDTMADTYEDMVRRGDPDAEAYGRNLQKKIDAYNKRINEEYKPAWDTYKRDSEAYEKVMSTIDAAIETGLTGGEKALLDALEKFTQAKTLRSDDVSVAGQAGAGAEQSAEFMLDFILTGGISKAGAKVATKIATNRALKKFGADALKEMARVGKTVKPGLGLRLGTDVVTSLARTGIMAPRTIQSYGENLTEYSGKDEAGRIEFDRSQANALGNSLLSQYIEYWSEGFGEYFGEAEQALFRSVTKNAPKAAIGQTLRGYRGSIGQFLDKGKFDGMFNEMLEEVVGSTFNALAGWMSGDRVGDAGAMKEFFAGENLATLALSFLPMSAIGAATNVSAYHKMKQRYDNGVAGLSKYFKTGAISPEELQQLSKDMPNLSPAEIKDKIVDITDRARKANGGKLPSDFTQNVLGYLEGEFAMGLRYDEWEDSQEKMSVVNAYTASYTNPDARAAWDLNDNEQAARQAALEAGFTDEELDNDSYMLAQEAFEIKGTQPERSDALMNYASAKAAAEGLQRGYAEQTQQVSDLFGERVRENLDTNGAVTTATIMLNGKPRTVFITQEDAGVDTTNGKLTTPTGPDGVVKYRLNEMDKEGKTAPASQFSDAQRTETDTFISDWQNDFQQKRAAYYEAAQNTVSPTGQARAISEKVGHNIVVSDGNGVVQPFKVERMTNGGSKVVISGDKKALQGVAERMGMRVPTSGYLEPNVTDLYPLLAKEEDGSLSTGLGEKPQQEAAPAAPAQEAAPAEEQTADLSDLRDQTVPISLNGQALNAHVLNTDEGKVVFELLDSNGDVTRTASLPQEEFARAMQAAQAPTPAAESKQTQAVKPMDAKDFDIDSIDFDNNYVILHQTGTHNFDSILQNGLRVGNGLNGTTTIANRGTLASILQAQTEGRGHEGSDGLVIMQIPKSWANGRDIRNLDQLDDILTERFGDSAIQTVPTDIITHVIATPKESSKASIPVDEKTGEKMYAAPGVRVEDAIADLYATEGLTEADVDQYIAGEAAKAEAARNPERGDMSPQAWGQAKQEAARVADFWSAMQRAAQQRKAQQEEAIEEAVEEAQPVATEKAPVTEAPAEQPAAESKQRIAPAETPMTFDSRRKVVAKLKNWARRTGVKVNIIRSVDEVKDETARKALKEGRALTGWFNDKTGQVDIFLPNVMNAVEADKTFIHETVAHKGLRGLLGEEGYDALCDRVWNELMTPEEQEEFMEYNRHLQGSDEYLHRAAADEYIARLSENMDMQDNRSIFEKIVDWVMDLLGLGGNVSGIEKGAAEKASGEGSITRPDLYDLLEDSLKRFEKGRKKLNTESLPAEIQNEMQEKGEVMDGGVVMDEQQDELKKATGYKTPNELDMESSPEVGNIRFSESTMPAWARNYMTYRDAKKHVVQVLENFTERIAADELVHNVVPQGTYKYGEKSSGGFAGPLRTNIEYIVTFDMDTSCPRSLQYLEYVKQIEAQIRRPMTQREMVQLIEMMRVYGQMIPCVYCYCENKRQALKQYYTDFIEARQGVINAKTEKEALDAMYGHSTKKEARESNDPAVALNPAAYEVFKEWRNGKQRYNPSIAQLWNQYNAERNAILSVLDEMLDSGRLSTNLTDEVIKNRLCKELGINNKNAKAAVKDIISEWKWDRIEDKPHEGFTRIEDEDMLYPVGQGAQMRDDVLSLWREMTSYGKSASQAKNVMRYIPYTDELKTLSKAQKDYINGMGGLRMHSSNDFRIDYVLDYFQFMADMAVNKMFGHTYSKSPEFVRIFGNSGYKINMSIAAYEDSHGIRPNPDEGFNWDEARELREKFPNAGVMLMATSDAQIQFALDNDWVDMCIPFHASGLPKEVWYDMRMWSDYSSRQNERFLNSTEMREELEKDGVNVPKDATAEEVQNLYNEHFHIHIEMYYDKKDKKMKRVRPHFLPGETVVNGVKVPGHNNDYERYISLCRQWGVRPRFYGIKVKDNTPEGGGREVDITEHPGYMKFIKETARTDTPQTAIEFNFDQPSEALGGKTPIDYAFEELQSRAQSESEAAGGPVRNIYESYKQDTYGIVPQFISGVINHEEEYRKTHNGEDLPLDFLTPDSRKWFKTERKALESAYKDVDTIPYHPHEYDENGNLIMEPEVKVADLDVSKPVDEGGTHFREVTRPGTIKKLEDGPKVKVYRSMQFIPDPNGDVEYDLGDGNGLQKGRLYAPMSAKVDGKWRDPIHLNRWEEAEENPDMADENGDFYLDKGDGSGLMKVAYAPYLHTRRSPLNEQFSSAYKRGNLVIVESEIPESELTSNYTANKSKKSTGEHDWPSGKVSNALAKKGMDTRKVILSRWAKPVRLVPNSEVADEIVKLLGNSRLSFPYNVVTPGLRAELAKRGVRFDGWQGNKPDNVDELIASMKEENESVSNTRFREANRNQLGFVSNADAALDRIRMGKATPEQWQKMLEKEGGLKAGEDKWLGLSDWLKSQDRKSITKQEVADYLDQHRIRIEEVRYADAVESVMNKYPNWDLAFEPTEYFDGSPRFAISDAAEALEIYKSENPDSNIELDEYDELTPHDEGIIEKWAENEAYGEKGPARPINSTRLGYTTIGLNNNREIALTVPTIEPWNESDQIHFGDAGEGRAVAWVRFGDTTTSDRVVDAAKQYHDFYSSMQGKYGMGWEHKMTADEKKRAKEIDAAVNDTAEGKRVLVIDEIQSKRHQEGRENGYTGTPEQKKVSAEYEAAKKASDDYLKSIFGDEYRDGGVSKKYLDEHPLTREQEEKIGELNYNVRVARNRMEEVGQDTNGIPAAPFEKNWHELAMKRMLRLAAEEGYDYVAWTTGAQQADRYSLSTVVNSIERKDDKDVANAKGFLLDLKGGGGNRSELYVNDEGVVVDSTTPIHTEDDEFGVGSKLTDIVGKSMADKMMGMGEGDRIEGEEIDLGGGDGMRGFYDDILPRFMNKYGKKWGVKVSDITLPNVEESGRVMHAVPVTQEMKESVMQGQTMFREAPTEEQQKEARIADAERQATEVTLDRMGEELGVKINRVTRDGMPAGHQTDKGYYDPATGEMTICMDNVTDERDAIATVLHETVGHKGLRELFGDRFREAMTNIYASLDREGREWVNAYITRHGLGFGEEGIIRGMEEYMSHLAESGNFKTSVWERIKEILGKIVDLVFGTDGFIFTDRELNYILRASYEHLKNPGWLDTPLGRAQNTLMKRELGINESDPNKPTDPDGPGAGILFRDGGTGVASTDYDADMNLWHTAAVMENQNADLPVKYGMERILQEMYGDQWEERMKNLADDEDYLTRHNVASSRAETEAHNFELFYFTPLLEQVREIQSRLMGGRKGKDARELAYERIIDYMYAMSGLERNAWKRAQAKDLMDKALDNLKDKYNAERDAINADSRLSATEKAEALDRADKRYQKERDKIEAKYADRDYSGITSLMGRPKEEWQEAEDDAQAMIDAFRAEIGDDAVLDELWNRTRACTDFSLEHAYKYGLLTREEFERLHGTSSRPRLWEYYIPLRGFAEDTAEDLFDYASYMGSSDGSAKTLEKAKGRWTEADNPLAYILRIAEAEIVQGNDNWAKQALYNFALKTDGNSLLTQAEPWYVKDPSTGKWVIAEPLDVDPNTGKPETLEDFEERMQALRASDPKAAKKGRRGLQLDQIMANKGNRNQHMIRLKVGGVDKRIWVNGNPAIATAVNGRRRAGNVQWLRRANRVLSNLFTTYSIDFTAKNLIRDTIYSRVGLAMKEDKAYRHRFSKNWWNNFGYGAFAFPMVRLAAQWESGELQRKPAAARTEKEQMFIDFMTDGGQTGYTIINSVNEIKRSLERSMRRAGKDVGGVTIPILGHYAKFVKTLNEGFELLTRFTAYQTSRDMGRSGQRAASDAKEISVNFNRRGAQSGEGIWGNIASYLGATHYFYNAGVQGFDNFLRLFKAAPVKMSVTTVGLAMMGILTPMINSMIAGALAGAGGDGDDDWYWNVPEWVRRNNIIIGMGNWYIAVPLPVEFRAAYGLGDIAGAAFCYQKTPNRTFGGVAGDMLATAANILPVNPIEGYSGSGNFGDAVLRGVAPDAGMFFVDWATNRDYTGRALWKENPFNDTVPKSQGAYASTPKGIVRACQGLAQISGGNIDVAPGLVRDFMNNYGGGFFRAAEDVSKIMTGIIGNDPDRPFRWDNIPFFSGFTGHIDKDRSNSFAQGALREYQDLSDGNVKALNAICNTDELTAAKVYGDPEEIPEEYRAKVNMWKTLHPKEYELGKMYREGMNNQYKMKQYVKGEKKGQWYKSNEVEKYGVTALKKQWKDLREFWASMPENTAEQKAEKAKVDLDVQEAWHRYYDAEADLADKLMDFEYGK